MKKYVLALALGLGFAVQAQVQDFTLPLCNRWSRFHSKCRRERLRSPSLSAQNRMSLLHASYHDLCNA